MRFITNGRIDVTEARKMLTNEPCSTVISVVGPPLSGKSTLIKDLFGIDSDYGIELHLSCLRSIIIDTQILKGKTLNWLLSISDVIIMVNQVESFDFKGKLPSMFIVWNKVKPFSKPTPFPLPFKHSFHVIPDFDADQDLFCKSYWESLESLRESLLLIHPTKQISEYDWLKLAVQNWDLY